MNYDAHHRLYDGQDHNYYYKAIASDLSWLEQQFTPAMKPLNNSVAEITQEPLVYYCMYYHLSQQNLLILLYKKSHHPPNWKDIYDKPLQYLQQ